MLTGIDTELSLKLSIKTIALLSLALIPAFIQTASWFLLSSQICHAEPMFSCSTTDIFIAHFHCVFNQILYFP